MCDRTSAGESPRSRSRQEPPPRASAVLLLWTKSRSRIVAKKQGLTDLGFGVRPLLHFVRSGTAYGDVDSAARYWATMSQDNVEVVSQLITALNERDVDRYLSLCAPEIELREPTT